MPLALDRSKQDPQNVELRVAGGGMLENGRLRIAAGEIPWRHAADEASAAPERYPIGCCDGLKGAALYGWAWNPGDPEERVEVELWVDGVRVAACVADGMRPDLRREGIGDCRYGWKLPVDLDLAEKQPLQIEVRLKDGPPLKNGVFELTDDLSVDDPANADLHAFVASVLGPAGRRLTAPGEREPVFLLHLAEATEEGRYWSQDYDDYAGTLRRFLPVLAQVGEAVELIRLEDAAAICAERRERGQSCLLLSFGPPRRAPADAPCPVVPVFGWAFPNIPTGAWDGDPRSDWRTVLRRSGRAITLSTFAAEAVRAEMGSDFPVAAINPPTRADPPLPPAPSSRRSITLRGIVYDSRDHQYEPTKPSVAPISRGELADGLKRLSVDVEGVLFTSFLDINDGRKNWGDLVTAFATAHRDNSGAVLLVVLDKVNASWIRAMHGLLARLPAFQCRILGVRGALERAELETVVAATHWYVSPANAEAVCLPMLQFLEAGRPAVAPAHTALADLVSCDDALVVPSDEELWRWPEIVDGGWSWTQHPDDVGPTTRHRVSWEGLVDRLDQAYRLSNEHPDAYARLAAAATARVRSVCSQATAGAAVTALMAQQSRFGPPAPSPSQLVEGLAAE